MSLGGFVAEPDPDRTTKTAVRKCDAQDPIPRRPRLVAQFGFRSQPVELTLAYEQLAITAEPGLVLMVDTAEPGSPAAERLRLLASWAAASAPGAAGSTPEPLPTD